MKKMILSVVLLGMGAMASAEIINNAGMKRLEQDAVTLLSQANITPERSMAFLKNNRFDLDDVNWKQPAQVIHGPYHMIDGDEEADNTPYLFAYNQGENIVGVGGFLQPALLKKLQALPQVTCQNTQSYPELWACAHSSAPVENTKQFLRDLQWLMENSN
ncbi:hypothetical protein [Vitreoscilla stercoraria]|nr:hypothetical protein [Vitreoscilla stercoraria]AUZ05883.2 hypothetical protein ADP71_25760 [Vitreoscilla sp. C1]